MKPKQKRKNPKSRNFGLGNRCMDRAVKNALGLYIESFSTQRTLFDRWRKFSRWLKKKHNIKDLRKINKAHLIDYGTHIKRLIEIEELAIATAHNDLSAINEIMKIVRGDNAISAMPVEDCQFPKRTHVCQEDKSVSESDHQLALQLLEPDIAILLEIQRCFGLRFEESAKFNPTKALHQALDLYTIHLQDGTKGGRLRIIPIVEEEQIIILNKAKEFQQGYSLIPQNQTYKAFRKEAYVAIAKTPINFHGERHWYAHKRYKDLTTFECPVKCGMPKGVKYYAKMASQLGTSTEKIKSIDKGARLIISHELGHGRSNIASSYLG